MAHKYREFIKSDFSPIFNHLANVLCDRIIINNLPEEIDEKFFTYHLLVFGRLLFFKDREKYHVMWFTGKGNRNEYYIQKDYIIVNPWYKEETSLSRDDENSVIIFSDTSAYLNNCDGGFYELLNKYSEIIGEIDKSIKAITKNAKVLGFITGSDSNFIESANTMIKYMFDGDKTIGVLEESLVDNIRVNPISDKMDYKLSELIKARQYYYSDFLQLIGIATNQNMKKERLTDNESQLIENNSQFSFNNVIDTINFSLDRVNKMFNLNISVEDKFSRLNKEEEEEKEKEEEVEEVEEVEEIEEEKEKGDEDGTENS